MKTTHLVALLTLTLGAALMCPTPTEAQEADAWISLVDDPGRFQAAWLYIPDDRRGVDGFEIAQCGNEGSVFAGCCHRAGAQAWNVEAVGGHERHPMHGFQRWRAIYSAMPRRQVTRCTVSWSNQE